MIRINEIRQFLGAALRFSSDLRNNGQISDLSPIMYAFWTTSGFHPSALDFCKKVGIWAVSGEAILKLTNEYSIDIRSSENPVDLEQ